MKWEEKLNTLIELSRTNIQRKKRREFSGSVSGWDFLYMLKIAYTSRRQHLENILPTISEEWLYDILMSIKNHYEYILKSVDFMIKGLIITKKKQFSPNILEILVRKNQLIPESLFFELLRLKHRCQSMIFDSELTEKFELDNLIYPLVTNLKGSQHNVELFLNNPPQLEGLLPSIAEQWLKDIFLVIREYLFST